MDLSFADIQSPFFASVARAVEDVAQKNNYSVIFCNTDENHEKERMYLEMVQSENAAGIILAPTLRLSDNFELTRYYTSPIVIIDRQVNGYAADMVLIDNYQAALELTRHVLAHGYRSIAALFGDNSATGQQRKAGFDEAVREAGLTEENVMTMILPATDQAAHEAITELLNLETPPEAIITSNGRLGAGAFQSHKRQRTAYS